jgi:hypothetical protein
MQYCYLLERSGGGATLLGQGAALLAGSDLRRLASAAPEQADKGAGVEEARADAEPRISFALQMRLFPDNLEIRIIAVQHRAVTAGDVMVFIPAEKVLITGQLFVSGSFPESLPWARSARSAISNPSPLNSSTTWPPSAPNRNSASYRSGLQNRAATRMVCPATDCKRVRRSVPRARRTLLLTLLADLTP